MRSLTPSAQVAYTCVQGCLKFLSRFQFEKYMPGLNSLTETDLIGDEIVLLLELLILYVVLTSTNWSRLPKIPLRTRSKGFSISKNPPRFCSRQVLSDSLYLTRYNCRPRAGGHTLHTTPFCCVTMFRTVSPHENFAIIPNNCQ